MSARTFLREPQVIDVVNVWLINPLRDEALLRRKHFEEGLSPKQIALQLGVSRTGVLGRLRRIGVPVGQAARPNYLRAQTPYGWRKEKGKLVPHAEEQRVIERIRKEHSEGKSLHWTARGLDKNGIKAKNGGKWNAKVISRILKRNG